MGGALDIGDAQVVSRSPAEVAEARGIVSAAIYAAYLEAAVQGLQQNRQQPCSPHGHHSRRHLGKFWSDEICPHELRSLRACHAST